MPANAWVAVAGSGSSNPPGAVGHSYLAWHLFRDPGGRALSFGAFATCGLATSPSSFLRLPTGSFDGDGQDDCGVVIAPKAGPSPDVTPTLTVTGATNPATFYDRAARVGAASGGYTKP